MIRKSILLGAGVAMALGFAGSANAALLSISGGTGFATPGSNDVLGAGVGMFDNAGLATTAAGVRLDYYFLGAESGFTNTLTTPFGTHPEANGNPPVETIPFVLTTLFGGTQAAAGGVTLGFTSDGFGGTLSVGGGDGAKSIALAYLKSATCTGEASIAACISVAATDYVLFALDDSGAGPDDNHDDYVGVLVASRDQGIVPIPAAAWLLGSGLLGLFGIGRRRKTAA